MLRNNKLLTVLFAAFAPACIPLVGGPGEPCTSKNLCITGYVCEASTQTCVEASTQCPLEMDYKANLGLCRHQDGRSCPYFAPVKDADSLDDSGMCLVEAGDYPQSAQGPELTLPMFFIDRYEVSNDRYRSFIDSLADDVKEAAVPHCAVGFSPWLDATGWVQDPLKVPSDFRKHPVGCVTLDQADKFCTWAGKHLPSHSEWLAAGTGSTWQAYPWGPVWHDRGAVGVLAEPLLNCQNGTASCIQDCCMDGSGFGSCNGFNASCIESTAVCDSNGKPNFPQGLSPCGAADLSGNVAEWVIDDAGAAYTCGGSYNDPNPDISLTACELRPSPNQVQQLTIGFRCAWSRSQ